jgi:hypothetical protein
MRLLRARTAAHESLRMGFEIANTIARFLLLSIGDRGCAIARRGAGTVQQIMQIRVPYFSAATLNRKKECTR